MLTHLLIPLCVSAALQSSPDTTVRRRTLPNGLEVIVVQNAAVPLATALVAVRSGAFTQDTDEAGLAHLYEHLLFHSFRHTPEDFAIEVSNLKGIYNGMTSWEVVAYHVTVPSKNIEPGIGLLAELLTNAHFSNGALKAERAVVLDELQRRVADPAGDLERQVARTLWGPAWHRKDFDGDSASLQRISVDRLQTAYTRYYVPNNAALIVTGDVDPARIFAEAERRFGDWKSAADPFVDRVIPAMPPLARTTAVMVARDVLDVTIVIAIAGPSVSTDPSGTYAADVLSEVFNDPTSAFQRRLVSLGPFQSISASYQPLNHTGPIEFRGTTTPQNAEQAIVALISELQRFDLLQDITSDDLAIARKRRQVEAALERERIASLAPDLASWWSVGGMDYYLSYDDHLMTQTADSLRRFAHAYIVGAPRVIGVLGTPAVVTRIGDWLRRGAPAP
ncbi:MAG TPA: pitrilysin family protein [Gemmatimonadales bacterium]|jgi:zinc protease|nr:pitrilysin family protein [Gemmatimonadales bacterium]